MVSLENNREKRKAKQLIAIMINGFEERRTNWAGEPGTKRVALGVGIVSYSDLQVM